MTVSRCFLCKRSRRTNKKQGRLCPISSGHLLDWVTTNIRALLSETEGGNRYIVVITDRYYELNRASSNARTTATRIATISREHLSEDFGTPLIIRTDNSPNAFPVLCGTLRGTGRLNSRSCKVHPAGQWTALTFQVDHDLDALALRYWTAKGLGHVHASLELVDNVHVYGITKLSPFILAATRIRPGTTDITLTIPPRVTIVDSPIAHRLPLRQGATLIKELSNESSKKSQTRYKNDYD